MLKTGGTIDVGYIPSQDLPPKPSDADVPSTNPLGSGYYLAPNYPWSVNYFVPNFNNPRPGAGLQAALRPAGAAARR